MPALLRSLIPNRGDDETALGLAHFRSPAPALANLLDHACGEFQTLPRQFPVRHPVRAVRLRPEPPELVLLIGFEIAFEPFDVAVPFEGEDVGGEAVEEEAVVADHHRAAGEILERVLEGAQGLDVEVVGRLVEQEDVAALLEHLGHVDPVALAAGELADLLLLVLALEVEGADIGAGADLVLAEAEHVAAARDLLPDVLAGVEVVAGLVDIAQANRLADPDRAGIGLLLAADELEQRRLAGAIGADDSDDPSRWEAEGQVVEQQFVAIGLGEAVGLDHGAAEALGDLDEDLRLAGRAVLLRLDQFVERLDAGLGLGLARLGRAADPFELLLDRLLLALLLALFLLQPLGFLLQVSGIIGFVDVVAAAIELEHPVHDMVEEVAVVGDEDDVARIVDEMLLEPLHALGVEMVGRLVEQDDVGLLEQQAGERHAPLLAARKIVDPRIAGRTAEGVHRDLELVVER